MRSTLYRATAFALYQLSLIVGILLLPVALVTSKIGFTLPVHRVVDRANNAYERTTSNAA
jgi:hypothetical protein